MPTLSVGVINRQRGVTLAGEAGVTLLEMMIVVTLLAVAMGLVYPSVNNGLDGIRLRSAADGIAGVVNSALTRAERRQRRFLFYPGGAVPRIGIEIVNPSGRRRIVSVDPVTGAARIEEETK